MGSSIAVLGAGGHTGRFVVAELRRRSAIARPATRSGRLVHADGSDEAACAIDFADPASLDRALGDADAVINCAGPFLDTAEPAVEAAQRAGIPYLDVTAEQRLALRLFERFHGRARAAGVTIVPAMAFYGGLADLLASALVGPAPAAAIEIAVWLDSWHPTAGTRLTGERNRFERMLIREGRLRAVPTPAPSRDWNFPAPIGDQAVSCVALSEIILISRHIEVQSVTSFMNRKPLDDLHDPRTPPPLPSAPGGRSAQRFVMDVRVTANGSQRRATAQGRDIYAASAPLVVGACLSLLAREAALAGVRAPGELFEPRAFLAALAPDLVTEFHA